MSNLILLGASGFVGLSLQSELFSSYSGDVTMTSSGLRQITEDHGVTTGVSYVPWDVRNICDLMPKFETIIHAATPASALLNSHDPNKMFELNIQGMENVIEFASRHPDPPTVLFTSSGAVYGDITDGPDRIPEDWTRDRVSPPLVSAYARGKVVAESMLKEATDAGKCVGLIARLFAFSGVHLPIDKHFAIGNFVRDVVRSQLITIRSDGSSVRSYMDGHDLAMWLLRIVEAGSPNEIYHIGSERAISIRDLASLVSERYEFITNQAAQVEILGESSPLDGVSRYVPSTYKTRHLLGIDETITLETSIDQMIQHAINTGLQ